MQSAALCLAICPCVEPPETPYRQPPEFPLSLTPASCRSMRQNKMKYAKKEEKKNTQRTDFLATRRVFMFGYEYLSTLKEDNK